MVFVPAKLKQIFASIGLLAACLISLSAFYFSLIQVDRPFSGFLVGPNLVVSSGQRPSWLGPQGDVRPLDRVLAINGHPIHNVTDFHSHLANIPIHSITAYTLERDNQKLLKAINAAYDELTPEPEDQELLEHMRSEQRCLAEEEPWELIKSD